VRAALFSFHCERNTLVRNLPLKIFQILSVPKHLIWVIFIVVLAKGEGGCMYETAAINGPFIRPSDDG
jgi:hypothetical protein